MQQTHGGKKKTFKVPHALQMLIDYPAGTWIEIGERRFYRLALGSFWREDHPIPGNCTSRPSVSIRNIELFAHIKHKVIRSR